MNLRQKSVLLSLTLDSLLFHFPGFQAEQKLCRKLWLWTHELKLKSFDVHTKVAAGISYVGRR